MKGITNDMVELKIDLPEDFLLEEVRDGYFVSKEMKEIWAVQLDLLNEFMRVCDENQIEYYMDAGTILGAVRHKGYIPWDDDIDVMMMREEYDKLCSVAEKEFNHPFFFQTEYTDKGSLRGHAQLRNSETTGILKSEADYKFKFNQGIFLDIFPIDVVPNSEKKFEQQLRKVAMYRKKARQFASVTCLYTGRHKKKYVYYVKKILHFLLTGPFKYMEKYEKNYKKSEKWCSRYNSEKTEYVAKYFCIPMNKKRRVWPRKDFESKVYMPFEMLSVPVPIGYEDILERFYGNWKEYVIGTSTHGGVIFDVNKSYLEYIKK